MLEFYCTDLKSLLKTLDQFNNKPAYLLILDKKIKITPVIYFQHNQNKPKNINDN